MGRRATRFRDLRIAIALAASLACTSCATIFDGKPQRILVDSRPQGAEIYLGTHGQYIGTTPVHVVLDRSFDAVEIRAEIGQAKQVHLIKSGLNPAIFGNILFGGLIGVFIDLASGAAARYPSEPILIQFADHHDA